MKETKYYLWFGQDLNFSPILRNYILGRIEVHTNHEPFAIKEIKVFTNKELEFNEWFSTIPKILNSLEEVDKVEKYINEKINNVSITL